MQWFDTIAIQRTGRGTLGPEVFDQDVHRDWSAAVCASCHGWNLWDKGTMFYPAIATAPLPSADMPPDVAQIYREARGVAMISPRAAAALLRLAVELLIDSRVKGADSLNAKIGRLRQSGVPQDVIDALDIVRVTGNNAVHPGQIDVVDETADALFRLLNMLVDQLVTRPREISELRAALPQGAREAIARRDSSG